MRLWVLDMLEEACWEGAREGMSKRVGDWGCMMNEELGGKNMSGMHERWGGCVL